MERADVVAENSISRREIGVRDWRWFRAGLTWTADELSSDFRSGSELNLPILHFDQVFDFFAAVFFADLFGLLFHERTKVGQRARNLLSGFFLGIGESQKQLFDLLLVRTGIASETDIEVFGELKPGDLVVAGPYKALRELKPNARVKQEAATAKGRK